ncbi:MAG: phosphatidylglycerol lysyltransferase domain-containing protein [Nitrolancea sp.]
MQFRRQSFHAFSSTPRRVAAALVVLVGIFDVVSVLGNRALARVVSWDTALPFTVAHGTRTFVVLAGIFLILLGRGLLHGRRTAWYASLVLLSASLISSVVQGIDLDALVVKIGLIAILIWRQQDFRARPDVPTLRRGIRAALFALILVPLYALLGFTLMRHWFVEPVTVGGMLREALARMSFSTGGALHGARLSSRSFLSSISIAWGAVLVYAVVVVLRPVLQPTFETVRDRRRAIDLLHQHGDLTTSFMTTWAGNTALLNGERDAYVAYRLIGNVAIVLGDPIGNPDGCRRAIDEFLDLAVVNGWTPCFYGASAHYLREFSHHGLSWIKVGEDASVNITDLSFRGKSWQDVRTARNRARRENVRFEMIDQRAADPEIVRQLWDISAEWTARRGLPEMNFTLGHLTDPPDPEIRTAVAIDERGRVQGFLTWLPVYARHGWVVDLMRRRDDAFPGVMEFLIAESLLAFQSESFRFASLSAAPLGHVAREQEHSSAMERALIHAAERLDSFYHFASLNDFKSKFQPNWEPIYLAYAGNSSLPRIGYALLRAYLPTLSGRDVRQLITGFSPAGVPASHDSHDNERVPTRPAAATTAGSAHPAELAEPKTGGASNVPVATVEDWSGDSA